MREPTETVSGKTTASELTHEWHQTSATLDAKWHSFHFDILENKKGRWLQVTETRPSGRRQSILIDAEYAEAFSRELLKAVSELGAAPTGAHSASAVRPRAYDEWSQEEERVAAFLFRTGASLASIAEALQRDRGGVRSRLSKLGLNLGGER